jgi:AGCS family alanine or glycine:cation symporter
VGEWGRSFVSIALVLFTFTSMIYNYYIGENCLNYFSEDNHKLFFGFRVFYLAFLAWAAFQNLGIIFAWADVTMSLVAVVNLVAIVMLFKVCMRLLNDYDSQLANGIPQPQFNADNFADLNIDPTAWEKESSK